MPLRANLLEQMLFFGTNLGPKPVIDIWSALALPVVQAALETGVFAALHEQPATTEELASRIGIDSRGASMLLPVLESLDYVTVRDGRYHLSAVTRKWLMDGGAINFAAGFAFWSAVIPRLWHNLEESLRSGSPPVNLYAWIENEPEVSQHFQAWMVALATYVLPEIIQRVKISPDARQLLDVGGGHGLYAIGYCRRYPALQATVFDSPRALLAAQANIDQQGMATRIATHAGNFMVDTLPHSFDVLLLFNIIHGLDMAQNGVLVKKAAAALRPGGEMIIVEQLIGGGKGPLSTGINRLLGLNYFHLLGGQSYSLAHVENWLTDAECVVVKRIALRRTPGVTVIIGRKQADAAVRP